MDVYIKRYFWVLGVLVVMVCAVLAAKTTNHVLEAKFLPDSERPRRPHVVPRVGDEPVKEQHSKVGAPLADRNMFCSACVAAPVTPDAPVTADGSPPLTSLPLRLVATNVSTNDAESFATIQNTTSQAQGAYFVGDPIPEAGKVVQVRGKFVDFENEAAKRVERISLLAPGEAPVVAAADPTPESPGDENKDDLTAALDSGIRKVDDSNYEIDRALVDKILVNPTAVARGARVVPSIKNGQPNGFKLYAIRPTSAFAKIGLMNGDTINSINGFDLTTPDKALEVYTKVREANSLSVTLTRRGKPVNINYSIK